MKKGKPKPKPVISALAYDGGKPFVSGVELDSGTQYTVTATVNSYTASIVWKRDGNIMKTDSTAPFDYTWTPTSLGAHTFEVIPYSGVNASGTVGPSTIINWNVVEPQPILTTALVSWTQIANAQGYRVFWGTVSRQYSYNQDVLDTLQYRVPELVRGKTYYFSAKSFNSNQVSPFGNEVEYVP